MSGPPGRNQPPFPFSSPALRPPFGPGPPGMRRLPGPPGPPPRFAPQLPTQQTRVPPTTPIPAGPAGRGLAQAGVPPQPAGNSQNSVPQTKVLTFAAGLKQIEQNVDILEASCTKFHDAILGTAIEITLKDLIAKIRKSTGSQRKAGNTQNPVSTTKDLTRLRLQVLGIKEGVDQVKALREQFDAQQNSIVVGNAQNKIPPASDYTSYESDLAALELRVASVEAYASLATKAVDGMIKNAIKDLKAEISKKSK